jgi:hypothetical protein
MGFQFDMVFDRISAVPGPQSMGKKADNVSLPEGVSLNRVAQVLLDAWEVGSHQWTNTPLQLREGQTPTPAQPVPQDAIELFRLLQERNVKYLLVGGLAMLTYVQGRNTKDVDLLLSVEALEKLPELIIQERNEFFARANFRSVQVDLLLTTNPLFKIVQEKFAAEHRFAELEVPAVSVEGLIVLKLYALPSLYRQFDLDRVALYENDITMLMARHSPQIEPLFALVKQHTETGDVAEIRKVIDECAERANRLRQRTSS